MGNVPSQQAASQSNVPMGVLLSEISTLNQGAVCEMEVCPGPEFETEMESLIKLKMSRCKKHDPKTHEDVLIPIRQLDLHHLPPSARCPAAMKTIKDFAVLAVRLMIRYTSTERPDKFHCGAATGTSKVRYGTGFLHLLEKNYMSSDYADRGTFKIRTAVHVVFDDKEAEKTTVEFFFEEDTDRSGVVIAQGLRVDSHDVERDLCSFLCRVDDKRDVDRVIDRCLFKGESGGSKNSAQNLAFCVSHPHGAAQRVSIGQITFIGDKEPDMHCDHVRILAHRCQQNAGINEKKVLYHIWDYDASLVQWCRMKTKEESEILSLKAALLKHLENKGLICPTTDRDKELIEMEDKQLGQELAKLLGSKSASSCKTVPQMNKESKRQFEQTILKEIFRDLASDLSVSQGFSFRYEAIRTEIFTADVGMISSSGHKFDQMSTTRNFRYSVPTCPGSSGALVVAAHLDDQGLLLSFATHSLGSPCNDNSAGVGLNMSF